MGFLSNYNITSAANPATMLLTMLDDYVLTPIPASHMISGSVNLQPLMNARSAVWSKVGSNDYYGKIVAATTPYFIIRTNVFGTTSLSQIYGQILVSYHAEF